MDVYEILLSGDIGFEITSKQVRESLVLAGGKDLNIKLSSDGGNVAEVTIIRNDLIAYASKHSAKINFELVGWVQSAGSYLTTIPSATVTVSDDSLYMYHNPVTGAFGDHFLMSEQSDFLRSLAETYATGYSLRSGIEAKEILLNMKNTTFLIGQEIIDAGFADRLVSDERLENVVNLASKKDIVSMSKSRYNFTSDRLVACALGVKDKKTASKEAIEKGKPKMEKEEKEEKKEVVAMVAPVVVDDKERATACMKAQNLIPKQYDNLVKSFEAGMSADYFNGMIAHVEMLQAEKKENEAINESPESVTPVEPEIKQEIKKTAGMTGETVEV